MGEIRHVEKAAAKLKQPVEAPKPMNEPEGEWVKIGEPPAPGTPGKVDLPFDGRPYLVTRANEDKGKAPDVAEATWRTTRFWDAKDAKWQNRAFWSQPNSGGQPLSFVPTHWRKVSLVYMTPQ